MEAKEPKAMEEIHKIRVKLYEEAKDLPPAERALRINKIAKDFLTKYHLENRWIKSTSEVASI